MDRSSTKAEILGALSHALDLVEGQPEGHAERSARIALRLGQQLGLDDATLKNLYYAGVLDESAALDADIDSICEAFAIIIDAKSGFTAEHSTRVTQYAMRYRCSSDSMKDKSRRCGAPACCTI